MGVQHERNGIGVAGLAARADEEGYMQIQSGYKTITPIQFANALAALDRGEIDHHDLRVYLACFVLVAVREAAKRYRRKRCEKPKEVNRYGHDELERLTGLNGRQTRRAVKRLESAGLLTFSGCDIVIGTQTLPGSEILQERLACRRSPRRPIPVPRSMLRFLAHNRTNALTKVVIAYLVRGMSIAHHTGAICAKGTVKASWVVETFGLSHRAVKYAQAALRAHGWITKDTQSRQRKLNRDGAYFGINLAWSFRVEPVETTIGQKVFDATSAGTPLVKRNKVVINFAPPPMKTAPTFAPPIEDRETSIEENKDQKTRRAEPRAAGFCKEGKGEGALPPPTLRDIRREDFHHLSRLEALYFQAIERGWIDSSEAMALNFIAAAVRAREVGNDPPRLFVTLVRSGLWRHITQTQEDQARRALARLREENAELFRHPRAEIPTGKEVWRQSICVPPPSRTNRTVPLETASAAW